MSEVPVTPWGPDSAGLTTSGEMRDCLRALYVWSGRPQYRRLAAIAGTTQKIDQDGHAVLNPKTGRPIEQHVLGPGRISELLRDRNGGELPSLRHVEAFVRACLVHVGCPSPSIAEALKEWHDAWQRVAADQDRSGTSVMRTDHPRSWSATKLAQTVARQHVIYVFGWLGAVLAVILAVSAVSATFLVAGSAWPAGLSVGAALAALIWSVVALSIMQVKRDQESDGKSALGGQRAGTTRQAGGAETAVAFVRPQPQVLNYTETYLYRLVGGGAHREHRIGIITGDIRRIRCADVWVNPENTDMKMPRVEEYSTSAIIRFEGSHRDHAGRVVNDYIADELARTVAGRSPVAPGTAITTGAGELTRRNGVRNVIHVASVQGEPGAGYRQVRDVGRCVTNVLVEAEHLARREIPTMTILFPLLGTGVGGGKLEPTVQALLGAALDYLANEPRTRIRTILFQAYTDLELAACRTAFDTNPRIARTN
jgi:O-acetyl-ADP-ribose deacetylase (regulator of RNase III)